MKPSIVNRIKSNWTLKRLGKVAMTVAFTLVIAIFLLAMLGTVVQAAGLVDDTVNVANEYSRYPLENYQLDFYVDNSWGWLPWNWSDGIGKQVMYGLYAITNFIWTISLYVSNATGYLVQEAYSLDFISATADSIGKNMQTLAGVSANGFSTEGFYVGFLLLLILVLGVYVAYGGVNVSAEVLAHKPMVEKYAKEYGVEEYVNILLAIIQVESGGTAEDVMQSSESLGLPPNSLSTEESIKQGVKYFSELLASSERLSVDLESVIQSYNYGGGFLGYVANRGNKYTFELAQSFSKEYSGGEKVSYPNPIAIPINGGWRYNYGNMFYVQLVTQYLVTTEFDDDTVQAIMDEALKYEGWRYVYGGASPTTSFNCSGLTQWTYGKAGINLPRTAQQQYDVTQHIPLSEAQAGDLVFFHSTYNAGSYITHVGIYLGNNRMFHAGDPIGYADLTSPYWQQHLVGAGRIKQ